MKRRLTAILIVAVLLSGCDRSNMEMDRILQLRQKMQTCQECSFTANITADYGEEICTFSMNCVMNREGELVFTVVTPESISGITGTISDDGGNLTFDNQLLTFPVLADDLITPVSAPWVLMQTLRGGYIRSCSKTDDGMMAIINDSYQEDSLQLDIWFDDNDIPVGAEIFWEDRRILSLSVSNMMLQ